MKEKLLMKFLPFFKVQRKLSRVYNFRQQRKRMMEILKVMKTRRMRIKSRMTIKARMTIMRLKVLDVVQCHLESVDHATSSMKPLQKHVKSVKVVFLFFLSSSLLSITNF
jgi:hypothetical protein